MSKVEFGSVKQWCFVLIATSSPQFNYIIQMTCCVLLCTFFFSLCTSLLYLSTWYQCITQSDCQAELCYVLLSPRDIMTTAELIGFQITLSLHVCYGSQYERMCCVLGTKDNEFCFPRPRLNSAVLEYFVSCIEMFNSIGNPGARQSKYVTSLHSLGYQIP